MAPRVKLTPELLDQARALRAKGLGVREIASQLGVGHSRLSERLRGSPGPTVSPARAPPAPPRPPRPASPQPPASQGSTLPGADDDDYAVLTEELTALRELRRTLTRQGDTLRVGPVSRRVEELVRRRRAIAPPVVPTAEELEAKSRPQADVVLEKIRSGVRAYAALEVRTGACCRCGGALSPSAVEERRAQSGEQAPPPPSPPPAIILADAPPPEAPP